MKRPLILIIWMLASMGLNAHEYEQQQEARNEEIKQKLRLEQEEALEIEAENAGRPEGPSFGKVIFDMIGAGLAELRQKQLLESLEMDLRMGRDSAALVIIQELLRSDSQNRNLIGLRGTVRIDLKDYQQGLTDLSDAINASRKAKVKEDALVEWHYYSGIGHYELERWLICISDFDRVSKYIKLPAKGLYCRGIAHLKAENYKEGITDLNQYLNDHRMDSLMSLELAFAYLKTRQYDWASRSFDTVLLKHPDHIVALAGKSYLTVATLSARPKLSPDSLRMLSAAVEHAKSSALASKYDPYLLLITVEGLIALKKYQEAAVLDKKSVDKFRDMVKDNGRCHNVLGYAYFKMGKKDDALLEYMAQMQVDPMLRETRYPYGDIIMKPLLPSGKSGAKKTHQ